MAVLEPIAYFVEHVLALQTQCFSSICGAANLNIMYQRAALALVLGHDGRVLRCHAGKRLQQTWPWQGRQAGKWLAELQSVELGPLTAALHQCILEPIQQQVHSNPISDNQPARCACAIVPCNEEGNSPF